MDLGGARADIQTGADLGGGMSVGGQLQHFPLSRRQRLIAVSHCSLGVFNEGVDRRLGKGRREIMKAGSDIAYGAHELLGGGIFERVTEGAVFKSVRYVVFVRMHRQNDDTS